MNNYSAIRELVANTAYDLIPSAISATLNASLQDQRIGMIAAGLSLTTAGLTSIWISAVPQKIYSWFAPVQATSDLKENSGTIGQTLRCSLALAGLAGTCIGVSAIALSLLQFTASPPSQVIKEVRGPFINPLESDDSDDLKLSFFSNSSKTYLNATSFSPNPNYLLQSSNRKKESGDCLFGPDEWKYNYLCRPGSHSFNSPVFGARIEEVKLLLKLQKENPKNYQILKDLERTLYDDDEIEANFRDIIATPGPNEQDQQDILSLKVRANQLASQMYSNFLNKYRPYGMNESNALEMPSQLECSRQNIAGGGHLSPLRQRRSPFSKSRCVQRGS